MRQAALSCEEPADRRRRHPQESAADAEAFIAAYNGFRAERRARRCAVRQLWTRGISLNIQFGLTLSVPVFNGRRRPTRGVRSSSASRRKPHWSARRRKSSCRSKTAAVSFEQGRASRSSPPSEQSNRAGSRRRDQDKLNVGVGTAYQVMLAERDLRTAESAAIQARTNYARGAGSPRSGGQQLPRARTGLPLKMRCEEGCWSGHWPAPRRHDKVVSAGNGSGKRT